MKFQPKVFNVCIDLLSIHGGRRGYIRVFKYFCVYPVLVYLFNKFNMNSIQSECNFKPEDYQTINNSNSFSYLPFLVKNFKFIFP